MNGFGKKVTALRELGKISDKHVDEVSEFFEIDHDNPIKVVVTPIMAEVFLKVMRKNRKIKENQVSHLINSMKRDEFVDSQMIFFDKEGSMADGQHRCHACLESQREFPTFLRFHIPESTLEKLDLVEPRNAADSAEFNSKFKECPKELREKLASPKVYTVVRLALCGDNSASNNPARLSFKSLSMSARNDLVYDFIQAYPDISNDVLSKVAKSAKGPLAPITAAAIRMLMNLRGADYQKVKYAINAILDDTINQDEHPYKMETIRNFKVGFVDADEKRKKNGASSQVDLFKYAITAFDKFLKGEPVKKQSIRESLLYEKYPQPEGIVKKYVDSETSTICNHLSDRGIVIAFYDVVRRHEGSSTTYRYLVEELSKSEEFRDVTPKTVASKLSSFLKKNRYQVKVPGFGFVEAKDLDHVQGKIENGERTRCEKFVIRRF